MGLDVYLERANEPLEHIEAVEATYNEKCEQLWKNTQGDREYDDLSKEERDQVRKAEDELKTKMGLVKYGSHPARESVELDSEKYPEHMFKIGYFRSSYNSGGLNSLLKEQGLPDLYEIFDVRQDDYQQRHDWATARAKAEEVLKQLRGKKIYRVSEISTTLLRDDVEMPQNSNDALDIFLQEREKWEQKAEERNKNPDWAFNSYSNLFGEFHMKEPLPIVGLIKGKGIFRDNCVYAVYEVDEGYSKWYEQALEIVIETCTWILNQKDSSKYYMKWSG